MGASIWWLGCLDHCYSTVACDCSFVGPMPDCFRTCCPSQTESGGPRNTPKCSCRCHQSDRPQRILLLAAACCGHRIMFRQYVAICTRALMRSSCCCTAAGYAHLQINYHQVTALCCQSARANNSSSYSSVCQQHITVTVCRVHAVVTCSQQQWPICIACIHQLLQYQLAFKLAATC